MTGYSEEIDLEERINEWQKENNYPDIISIHGCTISTGDYTNRLITYILYNTLYND